MPPNIELLQQLCSALLVEQEKRWRQKGYNPSISARVQLYERLDAMRARREALGRPYAPPTQAERDDLIAYLTETAERHAADVKR
jgi:hypothetical protein